MSKLYIFVCLGLFSCLLSAQDVTVAIIGSNDIHGAAFPATMIRADKTPEQTYLYGGLQYMGGLIDIIKQQYDGNVLYLDAGDQFQGGIESSKLISSGKIMNDFYDSLELNGSAIGNHEFDFGPGFLLPFMAGKNGPNLAANIRSERGADVFLPNQKLSQMYEFKSGIRIGVIGLSTTQTPTTTNAFAEHLFPDYKFLEYTKIIETEGKKLRKQGAHAVLLVSHIGDECPLNLTYGIWTAQTPQNPCKTDDEMGKLIKALPEGTLDGVLQGHRHVIAHHFKNGIPYMGSINGGYYFNVMYLTFNKKKQIVNRTIEGPIPVCEKVFSNLGRCNYLTRHELETAGELVNWRFHNKEVKANAKVQTIFEQEWAPKMNPYLQRVVDSEVYLQMNRIAENALGNLVTTLMHRAVPSVDFVIANPGGFRTHWLPGIIQYQHFYNMFPFDNVLKSFEISGKELLDMLTVLENGQLGFYQTSGLQQNLTYNSTSKKKGFVSAKFIDGKPIQYDQVYRGLTIDFLLNGGDDFHDVIGKVYKPRGVRTEGDLKELVKPQLVKIEKIPENNQWVDPQTPRMIVQTFQ